MITRYKCTACGKVTAGRVPKLGDGTAVYPRRHNSGIMKPCPGIYTEAIWVRVEDPKDKKMTRIKNTKKSTEKKREIDILSIEYQENAICDRHVILRLPPASRTAGTGSSASTSPSSSTGCTRPSRTSTMRAWWT